MEYCLILLLSVLSVGLPHVAVGAAPSAPSSGYLEGTTLKGLSDIAILTGREAGQAGKQLALYLSTVLNPDFASTPCFIELRSEEEESKAKFPERLVEDYHSAMGYSSYIQLVKGFYSSSIAATGNSTCVYCEYLANVERTVNTMKQSLENLIRFINESALLSETPPTGDAGDLSGLPQDKETNDVFTTLPSSCSSPCYLQQHRTFNNLYILATEYVTDDVTEYLGLDSK